MKMLKAKCGDDVVKTVWSQGEHRVALDVCVPNDWNMNKVEPIMLEKLKLVIGETLKEAGRLPPITCRPHPTKKRKLQIIDGEHRWRILTMLDESEIDVVVLYVSAQRAMSMTAELNYNRGEPDMEKYPAYLARMLKEFEHVDVQYLSERLPESSDEILAYLESGDFSVEELTLPDDDDKDDLPGSKDASNADALVELKFQVRQGAGEVIERELSRLSKALGGGKNVRGRALEVMAVLSSQTPDSSIGDGIANDEHDNDTTVSLRKKKKKKKKRDE